MSVVKFFEFVSAEYNKRVCINLDSIAAVTESEKGNGIIILKHENTVPTEVTVSYEEVLRVIRL